MSTEFTSNISTIQNPDGEPRTLTRIAFANHTPPPRVMTKEEEKDVGYSEAEEMLEALLTRNLISETAIRVARDYMMQFARRFRLREQDKIPLEELVVNFWSEPRCVDDTDENRLVVNQVIAFLAPLSQIVEQPPEEIAWKNGDFLNNRLIVANALSRSVPLDAGDWGLMKKTAETALKALGLKYPDRYEPTVCGKCSRSLPEHWDFPTLCDGFQMPEKVQEEKDG